MEETRAYIVRSIRDLIALGALIGLINWGLSPSDFGWLSLNPSPWLLFPALMGARHGIFSGLLAGVLGGLSIAMVNGGHDPYSLRELLQAHPFFFSALALVGFLAGEGGRVLRQENARLLRGHKHLGEQLQQTDAELELVREARHQLQQHLALHNASAAGLDDELRKVLSTQAGNVMDALLTLLHQQTLITSAALYRKSGDRLRRVAVIHPTTPLGTELTLDEVPLARRAMEEQAIASVKSALETTPGQPFLAAIPFGSGEEEGVLLVQDMPFVSFNWAQLARLELILVWTFSLLRAQKQMVAGERLVDLGTFKAALDRAVITEQTHHLPSVVVKFSADSEPDLKDLLRHVPPTALATRLPDQHGVAVLLPFGGEMEAAVISREWQKQGGTFRVSHYPVIDTATGGDFWTHVLKP